MDQNLNDFYNIFFSGKIFVHRDYIKPRKSWIRLGQKLQGKLAIDDDDQRQAERIARGENRWYYMVKDVELCSGEFNSTIDKKKENDAVVAGQSSHSESGKISKNTINIFDKIFDNFFLLRCFSISRS